MKMLYALLFCGISILVSFVCVTEGVDIPMCYWFIGYVGGLLAGMAVFA